jgi:hypothetical protein
MAQWDRDRLAKLYADERWQAKCPPDAVPLLRRCDHHTVWIAGRVALLLTYQWDHEAAAQAILARTVTVSFTYPAGHPPAPAEVQAVVDQLTFAPVSDGDRAS